MVTSVGTSASMQSLKAAIAAVTMQRAMNADAITVSTLLASIVMHQGVGASGVGGNVDIKTESRRAGADPKTRFRKAPG